ncbi:MAG TPA: nucleotidyltransferase domain-containing protein [Mycobacteriales bacterium]
MTLTDDEAVVAAARRTAWGHAAVLVARGAGAVVLVGSVARGDAHAASDIDLIALGEGPEYLLERAGGWLVSVSWRGADQVRTAFDSPADAGGVVPAWRGAVVLHDPTGLAAGLRCEALGWDWGRVSARCDRWVAEQVTGFAEEVHQLVGYLTGGRQLPAAVIRSVLAVRLPMVMAVHRRLFYDSESRLWDLVAEAEGIRWTVAQRQALALMPADEDEVSRAALEMYVMVARRVTPLLSPTQSSVVDGALELVEHLVLPR